MSTATKSRASASVGALDLGPMTLDPSDDCISQLQACRTRICALDVDGTPLAGADSMVVSDALVKLTVTAAYQAPSEISEKNACDAVVVDYLGPGSLTRYDLAFDFVTPDPFLHAVLLSGGALLTAVSGGIGFAFPRIGVVGGNGVSVEVWTKRVIDGALSTVHPYAHWALPKVLNAQAGAREFSNTAQHALINAAAYENPNWFDGPANDFDAATDSAVQWVPSDTLPDVVCGFINVVAS